jgi:hypothetical protein
VTLYANDADVHVKYAITDADGGDNDWASPTVTTGATSITCTWLGTAGPTRTLRVPLTGLAAGSHRLRLVVPGGNDVGLGTVSISA